MHRSYFRVLVEKRQSDLSKNLLLLVKVHTPHGGGVAVEGVHARPGVRVPHSQRPVGRAGDDDVVLHLGGPHAARVANEGPEALSRHGRPDLQSKQAVRKRQV